MTRGLASKLFAERHLGDLPDVLISNIAMPDRDGYELIREVRELMPGIKLPAIALTAYAREEDRRQAIALGFQTHLTKPIEPHELIEAVMCLAPSHAVRA
jgi:CheY-like chemotaxis protein